MAQTMEQEQSFEQAMHNMHLLWHDRCIFALLVWSFGPVLWPSFRIGTNWYQLSTSTISASFLKIFEVEVESRTQFSVCLLSHGHRPWNRNKASNRPCTTCTCCGTRGAYLHCSSEALVLFYDLPFELVPTVNIYHFCQLSKNIRSWSGVKDAQCACCLMGTDHGTGTKLRTGHAQYAPPDPPVAREVHICIARLKLWSCSMTFLSNWYQLSTSTISASFLKIVEVDNHGDLDVPMFLGLSNVGKAPCSCKTAAAVSWQKQQESQWRVLWRLWNWSTPCESLWISSPPPNFMRFLQLKPCFSLFLFSTFVDAGATLLRS